MNNSYITIIKEKRTALSRKRVPLNQNECTDDFRIGVPFEQNLHAYKYITEISRKKEHHFVLWIVFAITASFLYNERRTEKICTAVVERVSGKGKSTGAGK